MLYKHIISRMPNNYQTNISENYCNNNYQNFCSIIMITLNTVYGIYALLSLAFI